MQSLMCYGRILARALVSGLHTEVQLKNPIERTKSKDLHFVCGSSGFSKSIGKNELRKKWTFGDDAYFIARNKTADVIGVADGVGGWRNYGIDPSMFPRSLMEMCERHVKEGKAEMPQHIIAAGYREMLEQKMSLIGSSTACIVALHREKHTIYSANLGDSGFLVIRDGEIVHQSLEQQHYFNTPYQLSVPPPSQAGQVLCDSPDVAESSAFGVRDGDIILVATDGLFDNLSDDMILATLSSMKDSKEESVQATAHSMAEKALTLSLDPEYLSPFAMAARNEGIHINGGKPDDITVILARISNLHTDLSVT